MRVVLQKVNHASVSIDGEVVGAIKRGYMLLVGFAPDDGDEQLDYLVHKIVNLRVFEDQNGAGLPQPLQDRDLRLRQNRAYPAGGQRLFPDDADEL